MLHYRKVIKNSVPERRDGKKGMEEIKEERQG